MKFIKRLPINKSDPMDDQFVVLQDGRIYTNTRVALQLPIGNETGDRPGVYINGQIRYNETISETELYNGSDPGTGWEKVRTVRPAPIEVRQLGDGDYIKTIFGPLTWENGSNYTNYSSPQNIMVYIENVFQIPGINYTLAQGALGTVNIVFDEAPPAKRVYAILGYDGYFPPDPA